MSYLSTLSVRRQKALLAKRRKSAPAELATMREYADKTRTKPLPDDPERPNENLNEQRTGWANAALLEFMVQTGTEAPDALADLLADLMHWADRHEQDFDEQLERARDHYACETERPANRGAIVAHLATLSDEVKQNFKNGMWNEAMMDALYAACQALTDDEKQRARMAVIEIVYGIHYGFSVANHSEQPAWFHTEEAAKRFAAACGWGDATVETCSHPDPKDVMDTPETPWQR